MQQLITVDQYIETIKIKFDHEKQTGFRRQCNPKRVMSKREWKKKFHFYLSGRRYAINKGIAS